MLLRSAFSLYPGLAADFEVKRFEHTDSTYVLVAVVTLADGSLLYVRDYLFSDGSHKYAYHWQRVGGELIGRWDNELHWPDIATFPHHFHAAAGRVEASMIRCLDDVIMLIAKALGYA